MSGMYPLHREVELIVLTKHGTFLASSTVDFNHWVSEIEEREGEDPDGYEIPNMSIEVRSASLHDIMNLIEDLDVSMKTPIEDSPDKDFPVFRFRITLDPEEWVTAIARMGAGVTYRTFQKEVDSYIDNKYLEPESSLFLRNFGKLASQIYTNIYSTVKGRGWN